MKELSRQRTCKGPGEGEGISRVGDGVGSRIRGLGGNGLGGFN